MHSCFNDSLFRSILFVVLMENWHGFIVSSNKKIYMPWFDLCCSISNIKNSMQQNWTLIRHHLPGKGNGKPLRSSCLENSMDRGAWWATVHGVTKRAGHDLETEKQQTCAQNWLLQLESVTAWIIRAFFCCWPTPTPTVGNLAPRSHRLFNFPSPEHSIWWF